MTLRLVEPPASPPAIAVTDLMVREAATRAERDPFRWYRPTTPQLEMLRCADRRVCFRGPNQIGKTHAMAADIIDFMLGIGRWQPARARRHKPPVDIWVICVSWDQSKVIMRKIWQLMPKGLLSKNSQYTEENGFAGHKFVLANGSTCAIKTIGQKTEKLESATLDAIFIDEPPPEEIWGTLVMRTRNKRGSIRMYFTPVNRPTGWLEEMTLKGTLTDIHTRLEPAALWPVNDDGAPALVPFLSVREVMAEIGDVPEHERAMRVGGAWRGAPLDRYFPNYREDEHRRFPSPQHADWPRVAVGLDYGTAPGKMAAALVYVRDGHTPSPCYYFVDGVMAPPKEAWDGVTLAGAVKAMLERNGLTYQNVDRWVGDRPADARKTNVRMDNATMRGHLREAFKLQISETRNVHTAKKGGGSVLSQCSLLDSAFRNGRAWVSPAAPKELQDFFVFFNGLATDPLKDIGDAARYAAISLIKPHLCYRYASG